MREYTTVRNVTFVSQFENSRNGFINSQAAFAEISIRERRDPEGRRVDRVKAREDCSRRHIVRQRHLAAHCPQMTLTRRPRPVQKL